MKKYLIAFVLLLSFNSISLANYEYLGYKYTVQNNDVYLKLGVYDKSTNPMTLVQEYQFKDLKYGDVLNFKFYGEHYFGMSEFNGTKQKTTPKGTSSAFMVGSDKKELVEIVQVTDINGDQKQINYSYIDLRTGKTGGTGGDGETGETGGTGGDGETGETGGTGETDRIQDLLNIINDLKSKLDFLQDQLNFLQMINSENGQKLNDVIGQVSISNVLLSEQNKKLDTANNHLANIDNTLNNSTVSIKEPSSDLDLNDLYNTNDILPEVNYYENNNKYFEDEGEFNELIPKLPSVPEPKDWEGYSKNNFLVKQQELNKDSEMLQDSYMDASKPLEKDKEFALNNLFQKDKEMQQNSYLNASNQLTKDDELNKQQFNYTNSFNFTNQMQVDEPMQYKEVK